MEYLSSKEASKKWSITVRQVQKLCATGKIIGAKRLGDGKVWMIPVDAQKPSDGRLTKIR
jgi:hypothetical protein